MQQALAGEVMDWLVEAADTCDRAELLRFVNNCRIRFHQLHPEIPLFEISERMDVQMFCDDTGVYPGVTMPRDFQTVEQMWAGGAVIDSYSSWREWQRGYPMACECGFSTYQVPGTFAVERDLQAGAPSPLRVHCEHPDDEGKKMTVRCVDFTGTERTLMITLSQEPKVTDFAIRHVKQNGGVSKQRTTGHVVLAEVCGRMLSRYAPDETVPGYKRQKIASPCPSVYVRGLRQYFPVYDENEVVETANTVAWESMARFLRIDRERGSDKSEAAYYALQAKQALLAEHSRDLGKQTVMSVVAPMARPYSLGGCW